MHLRGYREGALLCLLCLSAGAPAGTDPSSSQTVYQRTLRATAWVRVTQDNKLVRMGTGFLIDRARKLLVTNQHVVDKQEVVEVVFPLFEGNAVVADKKTYIRYDRPLRGWVLAADPKRDLAVIELELVPHAALPLPLAADSLCPGEPVHLIGNPGTSDYLWAHNTGIVHQLSQRKLEDRQHGRVLEGLILEIRTRAAVIPGYSGGPAVNERGELVGVATMSNVAAHWAWCVDISEIRDVVRMVQQYPKAARRLLDPHSPADFRNLQAYRRSHPPADRALLDANEVLQRDPHHVHAYLLRGLAHDRQGEADRAVADLTEALRLEPQNRLALYNRALVYSHMGAYEPALADFQATLRLEPGNALVYLDRGLLHSRKQHHEQAVADFEKALQLEHHERGEGQAEPADFAKLFVPEPAQASAYNSVAWVWATSAQAERRDGKQAVAFATKACEFAEWKNASYLATLAAAYAECGAFHEAIRWQTKALALVSGEEAAKLRARLALYRAGQPYRER